MMQDDRAGAMTDTAQRRRYGQGAGERKHRPTLVARLNRLRRPRAGIGLLLLCALFLFACSGGGDAPTTGTPAATAAGSGTPAAGGTPAPPTAIGGSASKATLKIKISGTDTFEGDIGEDTACLAQQIAATKAVNVGAAGDEVSVNFVVANPRTGSVPVGAVSVTNLTGPQVTSLSVKVKDRLYLNGKGEATLTDAEGKKGSLHADGFTVVAGQNGGDVSVDISWACG